jgi:Thioredoxin domain
MSATPPDALLFITSDCAHCPAVLQALSVLLKQALIGKLTVVNVAVYPEQAAEYGVRSAPWLRLGDFTFTGACSMAELSLWTGWAGSEAGTAHYVEHLLREGGYRQAVVFIQADLHRLKPLLAILIDPNATIDVRLGVSALLEAYRYTPALQELLPQLAEMTLHTDHRFRADACYLLGLTGSAAARAYLAACLNDTHQEVREIAKEAMEGAMV